MSFAEYVRRFEGLRRLTAQSRPRLFFLTEGGRYAAGMALVLVVLDATPFALWIEDPLTRVWFIGVWSVLMAGWSFWRLRGSKDETQPASPPAI